MIMEPFGHTSMTGRTDTPPAYGFPPPAPRRILSG